MNCAIHSHGKAYLSELPPWRAATNSRLVRGRSRVRAPTTAGLLHAHFPSTLFLSRHLRVRVKVPLYVIAGTPPVYAPPPQHTSPCSFLYISLNEYRQRELHINIYHHYKNIID